MNYMIIWIFIFSKLFFMIIIFKKLYNQYVIIVY